MQELERNNWNLTESMMQDSKDMSYEKLISEAQECSEEEYMSFIEKTLNNKNFPVQQLYIELSPTQAHIVAEG